MRGLIHVLLIGGLFLAFGQADAREWASRDGRFTVEAELLTVEADQVVLRRQGGSIIRVPLERLSLDDVRYVQEAMKAAGLAPPPETKETPRAAPVPKVARAKRLPLARPGRTHWQAAPDPA